MKRLKIYTDWLDWGLGFSLDCRLRVAQLDVGPWDIELDFEWEPEPEPVLPPDITRERDEWIARIRDDKAAAGTLEFIEWSKRYARALRGETP